MPAVDFFSVTQTALFSLLPLNINIFGDQRMICLSIINRSLKVGSSNAPLYSRVPNEVPSENPAL